MLHQVLIDWGKEFRMLSTKTTYKSSNPVTTYIWSYDENLLIHSTIGVDDCTDKETSLTSGISMRDKVRVFVLQSEIGRDKKSGPCQ